MPDANGLACAMAEPRLVGTLNRRHCMRFQSTMPEPAGMVGGMVDPAVAALAQRIHPTLEAQPQTAGQLLCVNRPAA
jgi:hypothetical protein